MRSLYFFLILACLTSCATNSNFDRIDNAGKQDCRHDDMAVRPCKKQQATKMGSPAYY